MSHAAIEEELAPLSLQLALVQSRLGRQAEAAAAYQVRSPLPTHSPPLILLHLAISLQPLPTRSLHSYARLAVDKSYPKPRAVTIPVDFCWSNHWRALMSLAHVCILL